MNNVRPDFSLNPMSALIVAYNTVASAINLLPMAKVAEVNKFSDKATAVKRLNSIIDSIEAAGFVVAYLPNGTIEKIDQQAATSEDDNGFVAPTEDPTLKVISTDGATTVAEPVVAAPAPARGKRQSALMGKTIELVTVDNPKRKDSRTRARYALYTTGLTTDEYMAQSLAKGLGTVREVLSDLHYDSTMGFIKLN